MLPKVVWVAHPSSGTVGCLAQSLRVFLLGGQVGGQTLLMNREKVNEKNKRFEERILMSKFVRPTHHDPDGRLHRLAAVGMIVIAVFQFVAIGTGLIET